MGKQAKPFKFKIYTSEEFAKAGEEEDKELAKMVKVDGQAIVLNGYYEISFGECNSLGKIIHWIVHLSGKLWVTAEIIERFVWIAMDRNGLGSPYDTPTYDESAEDA